MSNQLRFDQIRLPPECDRLRDEVRAFIAEINRQPEVAGAATTFSADVPQIFVNVDRTRAEALGVSVSDIYSTIAASFGSRYVNDFTL